MYKINDEGNLGTFGKESVYEITKQFQAVILQNNNIKKCKKVKM